MKVILQTLLFYVLTVCVFILSDLWAKGLGEKYASHIAMATAALFTFLLVIIFCRLRAIPLTEAGTVPYNGSPGRIITGFLAGLLMSCLQPGILMIMGYVKLQFNAFDPHVIGLHMLLFTLISCREELVFRSYALRSLADRFGAGSAQLFIAALFVFEHIWGGMNWWMALIGSGTGALLFGYAALKSKGIGLPLGLHTAWNMGQWCWGGKGDAGIFTQRIAAGREALSEVIGLSVFVGAALFAGLAIAYYYKRSVQSR
ncbi:lysostaphin resistance A-like protein [Mucilaginibacter sp. Mucisp84]|uniref:CPBP family intramembrane glutamic endopeptidase n=1 Tax=Mucilaginibacter sp. Mucisp84 TaxID=3243058 RepID=UPI0039A52792